MRVKNEISGDSKSNESWAKVKGSKWDLRLYIAGNTSKAIIAIKNLKLICEQQLNCKFKIEVIDLMKKPQLGRKDQILAIPALVRRLPLPVKMIVGDLSDPMQLQGWLNRKE
ncbi:MAG: circadian clock KaiB family protein [Ignavibacteria bacterium]